MRNKAVSIMLLVGILSILAPEVVRAEPNTIYVPGDYTTIQAAIDVAGDGDTVLVADGLYNVSDDKNLYWDGNEKHITVKSENGPNNCIIDCNNNGIGFYFDDTNQIDADVIDGFTIKNGDYTEGGGIYCYNSSPTIINCIITGNIANYGGGIYCDNSCPTITNCTISGNTAENYGGGIYCDNSSPAITNCSITGNTATYWGGGIYCNYSSSPTITNCTITGNTTNHWDGGGIYCLNSSSPEVNNCIITGNTAADSGGGIYCGHYSSPTITNCTIVGNAATGYYSDGGGISCHLYSSPTITNCTITGNTATGYYNGGGISCHDYSSPAIANCTITGNTATGSGGGIYCGHYSSPTITNCTISGNTAENYGGGICCDYSSSSTVANSILWNDSAAEGREVALRSADNPSTITISYSDVDGGRADIYRETGCYLDWGEGNIDADPLFVDVAGGDYHLLSESPCIDAGDPAGDYRGQVDMDGEPRVINGRVDIGADEYFPLWAVIVGVSNYNDPGIDVLPYAINDANNIYTQLLDSGWAPDHIKLLTDSQATKANIEDAIDWMGEHASINDVCLFFFSGYGTYSIDDLPPDEEADGHDEFICPADTQLGFAESAIRDDELATWMDPILAQKVIILDACRSGGFINDFQRPGYVILTACEEDKGAASWDELQHSVFTYYILEGLNGPADSNKDGKISAEELFSYASPRVVEYMVEQEQYQQPLLYDGIDGEVIIVLRGKIAADLDMDWDVDFADYAVLAAHWKDKNCAESAWCFGADINKSGSVDLFDLAELAEHWLVGR